MIGYDDFLLSSLFHKKARHCNPHLNMQALRKPLEKEVGITAPRHMRGDYYADSCFYK